MVAYGKYKCGLTLPLVVESQYVCSGKKVLLLLDAWRLDRWMPNG